MTITLPEEMRTELVARAIAEGFTTVDDYIQYLIAADLDPAPDGTAFSPDARARLRALAEEGLGSPPISNPSQFLADLVHETAPAAGSRVGQP